MTVGTEITRWKWRAGWTPIRTPITGFLLGFFIGAVALLPLGLWFGQGALLAIIILPITGAMVGALVTLLGIKYVNDIYSDLLEEFYQSQLHQEEDGDIWVTQLRESDTQFGLNAAVTYELTRVERTDTEVKLTDVSLDLATLETTEYSTIVSTEKLNSISHREESLVVEAQTGIWQFENVRPHSSNGFD